MTINSSGGYPYSPSASIFGAAQNAKKFAAKANADNDSKTSQLKADPNGLDATLARPQHDKFPIVTDPPVPEPVNPALFTNIGVLTRPGMTVPPSSLSEGKGIGGHKNDHLNIQPSNTPTPISLSNNKFVPGSVQNYDIAKWFMEQDPQ
jgi:hypothetical protein